MSSSQGNSSSAIGLRAGDWVEVRSAEEILATLDEDSSLDALPFMPEMLQYCGKRLRVFKVAHKTCDTLETHMNRRMQSAVHLEGIRCDGESHGGCQAGCLIFWKEAWLRRVDGPTSSGPVSPDGSPASCPSLLRATRADTATPTDERFKCQATEMYRATSPLHWWDPRHYIKDLTSRNIGFLDFCRFSAIAAFNLVMRRHWRLRRLTQLQGLAGERTPKTVLDLEPGELVEVRTKEEIMRTLNQGLRHRGLSFDVEMVPYCGRTFRVLRRVEKLIDEKTGTMIRPRNACIVLDGVTCGGCLSRNRMFCPRSIYPYWHESWLKRAATSAGSPGDALSTGP